MNVLLLGGAGFVGCSIAKHLTQAGGFKLTIADNFFRHGGKPDTEIIGLEREHGIRLIAGDFTDPAAFDQPPHFGP